MRSTVKARGCLCLAAAVLLLASDNVTSNPIPGTEAQAGFAPGELAESPRQTGARLTSASSGHRAGAASPAVAHPRLVKSYARLPLRFEANHGQTDREVAFLARRPGHTVFLTPNEALLALLRTDAAGNSGRDKSAPLEESPSSGKVKATVVRMKWIGANPAPRIIGRDELPGKSNYFIGNDPEKWRTGVSGFARVEYAQVYPGIDLIFHGRQGRLEYDFVLAPGSDPESIRLGFEGIDRLEVDARGDLVLHIPGGEIRQQKPRVYQEIDGERRAIQGGYRLLDDGQIGFQVAAYDRGRHLVIDPTLSYSTYLGGAGVDDGAGIAVDATGSAYVTGLTASIDFPVASPLPEGTVLSGIRDAFISKFDPSGSSLVYSTYLGGNDTDFGRGIAVDGSGNAYVIGETDSLDFPTTIGALQTANAGMRDAFVAKLDPAGSVLVYATYLGGNDSDFGIEIAVDLAGNAYLGGYTGSTNFPTTTNALQATHGGPFDTAGNPSGPDGFVAKLNASGSALAYGTYLGGDGFDNVLGIAADAAGVAYVTGRTRSSNFPVQDSSFQVTPSVGDDAFVAKIQPTGEFPLVCSTYLGGAGDDWGRAIAADTFGNAYVTGRTSSDDFPTTLNAVQSVNGGGAFNSDAFVTKLAPFCDSLIYSTYLGGSDDENLTSNIAVGGIAVDSAGSVYVTGVTASGDFPTVNAPQPNHGGPFGDIGPIGLDAFVTKLNSAGSALVYSTYLGGSGDEGGFDPDIALDGMGSAYVTGRTDSSDYPTSNPSQPAIGGVPDAFVAKLIEINTALQFDGIDDFVSIADVSGDLDFTTGFTVEAWVRPFSFGDGGFAAIARGAHQDAPDVGTSSWVLAQRTEDHSNWGLSICTPSCNAAESGPEGLQANTWQHVAGTYSTSDGIIRIIKDGTLVATKTHSSPGAISSGIAFLTVGVWEKHFHGLIDELRVWNVARSQDEIAANKNRFLTGTEPGLAGYWRFDEGAGQTTFDSTGKGNSGRLGTTAKVDSSDPVWVISTAPLGDFDGDGAPDAIDNCPINFNPDQTDTDDDGIGDVCNDTDGDGVPDLVDNCPDVPNGDQTDLNLNGIGDACEDSDEDGILDINDFCPGDADDDGDADGFCAGFGFRAPKLGDQDNCPFIANDQTDGDSDGRGDACDLEVGNAPPSCTGPSCDTTGTEDSDGDGLNASVDPNDENPDVDGDTVLDGADNCVLVLNTDQLDTDGDGLGNACDNDDDNDGVQDSNDNCPLVANADQRNTDLANGATDADSLGDACDDDIDGDGLSNAEELSLGTLVDNGDTDGDGFSDGPADPDGTGPITVHPDGRDPTPLGNVHRITFELKDPATNAVVTSEWLPEGSTASLTTFGNSVKVVATLQDPSGAAISFSDPVTFTVAHSPYPGRAVNETEVCTDGICQDDLSFATSPGTRTATGTLVTDLATGLETAEVTLYAFDYGATGTVTAETTVNGAAASGSISTPLDTDNDFLPDAIEVPLAGFGFDPLNATSLVAGTLDGEADVDTSADNLNAGDGIINRREWRGVLKYARDCTSTVDSHLRLNPRRKDLFVRGVNFKLVVGGAPINSSCNTGDPSPSEDVLEFSIAWPGGNAFENALIRTHDVTGMLPYSGTVEPPHIDIVVVTNKLDTPNTINTVNNGFIDHCGPYCWQWDTKGDSFIGNATEYQFFQNPTTGEIKRGTFTYHLNLMHYIFNRPYRKDPGVGGSSGALPLNPNHDTLLDPFDGIEDTIVENGADAPDRSKGKTEDRFVVNNFVDGDRFVPAWRNQSWAGVDCSSTSPLNFRCGHEHSIFDADGNGLVELPVKVNTPNYQINPGDESDPLRVQVHTNLHEICHAVGCRSEHTTDPTDLQYEFTTDWNRGGNFGAVSRGDIYIHNKTE